MTGRFRRCDPKALVAPELHDSIISVCNLCSHEGSFTLLAHQKDGVDYLQQLIGNHPQLATVCCPNCGWTFKPGRLSDSQLSSLYRWQGGDATVNASTYGALEERSQDVKRHIESVAATDLKGLRVLDVGGGAGQVSYAFAKAGCQVEILDLGAAASLHPSVRIRSSSFDDFDAQHPYELIIIMSHVLEHTWTPFEWLEKAQKLLSPDGVLFIEVPFELYTPYVKAKLGDPCHVGYFGKGTLADFLVKADLEVLSLVRTLAIYDCRRIAALRAVCKKGHLPRASAASWHRRTLLNAFAEMAHPHQLMLMLLRR